MSWLTQGIKNAAEGVGNWWEKDDELDRKVAVNQMVSRAYDRIPQEMLDLEAKRDKQGIGLIPDNRGDIKKAFADEEGYEKYGQQFLNMQKGYLNDGIKRGWTPSELQEYKDTHDGQAPSANMYSPGDEEYHRRVKGINLTNALLGDRDKETFIGTDYDPADAAADDYMAHDEYRDLLETDDAGGYLKWENLRNLMDNQYMGGGRVFVPSGERGFQNVARYFTHRDDGTGKLESFIDGTGEWLYDLGASLIGAEQSDTGKEIQNTLLAKKMSDRASPIVAETDDLEARAADANDMLGMKDNLDHIDYAMAYKNRTGENPHWTEEAVMNALPGFADWLGLLGPATAAGRSLAGGGLKSALKSGAKVAALEASTEDAPIMLGLSVPQTLMSDPNNMTNEQIAEEIIRKQGLHEDFTNRKGQMVQDRLNAAKDDRMIYR